MEVKLISVTQPYNVLKNKDFPYAPEELIVYIARVSNPSNQANTGTSQKLIEYLIKNKHWSPFEHVSFTVEIKTSRAIAAQILRHRSFSFQEFSQRYAEVTEFELIQLRKQTVKNRQSSSEVFNPLIQIDCGNGIIVPDHAENAVNDFISYAEDLYKSLLEAGVAKEVARMILPLTTQTTLYMTGTVRSWIHYLQIRCDEHTQLEHREIALAICEIFKNTFPNIWQALTLGLSTI